MIFALVASAFADSPSLRVPLPSDPTVVVALGAPTTSVAWRTPSYGVSLDVAASGAFAGFSVGTVRRLLGDDDGFRLDLATDAGLFVPLVDPGLGLTATFALQVGSYGERGTGGGFALTSPVAFRVAPGSGVRFPLQLEGNLAAATGPHVLVGALAGVGAAFVPGGPPAVTAGANLVVAWRP